MDAEYEERLSGSPSRRVTTPRRPAAVTARLQANTVSPVHSLALSGVSAAPSSASSSSSPRHSATYSDRFIPSRVSSDWETGYTLRDSESEAIKGRTAAAAGSEGSPSVIPEDVGRSTHSQLLRNEMLGAGVEQMPPSLMDSDSDADALLSATRPNRSILKFSSPLRNLSPTSSATGSSFRRAGPTSTTASPSTSLALSSEAVSSLSPMAGFAMMQAGLESGTSARKLATAVIAPTTADGGAPSPYALSPVSSQSERMLLSPRKQMRKISKVPCKVLDAPELQDDFYLNLLDWSSQNVLAVGLGARVYLWSACTSQVQQLCDLSSDSDFVTSVAWVQRGTHVAIGTHNGSVQVWDAAKCKLVRRLAGHSSRVAALAWNTHMMATGSRDRTILLRDVRASEPYQSRLSAHKQEVCGLRWSPDDQQLASGGNDNRLYVWQPPRVDAPVLRYRDHVAAVKAIAWSPHQHGLLASGGGTADRCIRFWNTVTDQALQYIDTGSQVCNLAWSKTVNELVSTHGYSQNQIIVWKYPSMTQVATLTGHTYRVLYLAMSPDGQTIVTGAGDETLRFWNVFSKLRGDRGPRSVLNIATQIR